MEEVQAKTETQVKKKPRSEALPAHLPEVTQIAHVPEADRVCEHHGPMQIIGTDETKKMVYEPAKLYCMVTKYPQYACPCCKERGVVAAERPTGLVEGDKYDTSVAAAIFVKKYDLHLPLYRLQDIFAGSGWTPSRSTLSNLLQLVDVVLEPLIAKMTKAVQNDSIVGLDETSCRMLMPNEVPEAKLGDQKAKRLADKIAEAKQSLWPFQSYTLPLLPSL